MNQNTNSQTLGCGAIVALVVIPTFLISTCSSKNEPTISDQIQTARDDIEDKMLEIIDATPKCASQVRPKSPEDIREESFGEFDIAIAENIDGLTSAQEWEIRRMLGAELGIPPSEVNGWKNIYKSRAEIAEKRKKQREAAVAQDSASWDYERQSNCDNLRSLKAERAAMKSKLKALKKKRSDQRNSGQ